MGTSVDYEARDAVLRLSRDPRPSVKYGFIEYGPKLLRDSGLLYEVIEYLKSDAHSDIRRAAIELSMEMRGF